MRTSPAAEGNTGRVVGIGTDIVEIDRIEKSLTRTHGFAMSIFSEGERAFCEAKARPAQHYAARFAAKEAFLKAIGRGVLQGVPLPEIEVVRDEEGPPQFRFGPAATRALEERGAHDALLSLSHDGNHAIAFVLVQ